MDREQFKEWIRREALEGKLACRRAFEIAREAGCTTAEVGILCDELKVKIVGCRLGCF